MSEDERRIYEMILRLASHLCERGAYQEAFTANFIAKEIAKGSHRSSSPTVATVGTGLEPLGAEFEKVWDANASALYTS